MRIIIILSIIFAGFFLRAFISSPDQGWCSTLAERNEALAPCLAKFESDTNHVIYCSEHHTCGKYTGPSIIEQNECFEKRLHGKKWPCEYCQVSIFGYGSGCR